MTHPPTTATDESAPGAGGAPVDLRRLLAFRGHGAVRLLLGCRARLEDVEGAVAAKQSEVAVLMAYDLLQLSLSIRGLRTEGELIYAHDEAAFDPFAGLSTEESEAALVLAAEGLDATGDRAEQWLDRLRDHFAETESLLGYQAPLPDVRSGNGMIKGFKLARTWQPLMDRVGLPSLLPDYWTRSAD
ncbi:hypothetical protein [Streptomyces sp. NPDC050121]|uniref:hypothetical protein n=1 Tax=Streptomyces sp. NPDC050121 TaxID=3365601 RepID=UPI0037A14D61